MAIPRWRAGQRAPQCRDDEQGELISQVRKLRREGRQWLANVTGSRRALENKNQARPLRWSFPRQLRPFCQHVSAMAFPVPRESVPRALRGDGAATERLAPETHGSMFQPHTARLSIPEAKHVRLPKANATYLLPSPAARVPQPQRDGETSPSSK